MIELTREQQQTLESGRAVEVLDSQTDAAYVLLPKDVYDRLRSSLDLDMVYTVAETLDAVMKEDDAQDPYLSDLQLKYGGRAG